MLKKILKLIILCSIAVGHAANIQEECKSTHGLPNTAQRQSIAGDMLRLEEEKALSLGLYVMGIATSHYSPSRFPFPLSCLLAGPEAIKPWMERHGFSFAYLNDGVTSGWLDHAERYMRERTDHPESLRNYAVVITDRAVYITTLQNPAKYTAALSRMTQIM